MAVSLRSLLVGTNPEALPLVLSPRYGDAALGAVGGRRRAGGRSEAARHATVIASLALLSLALQFSTGSLGSIDGYFHARYAELVWQGGWKGFPPEFPWLPFTIRSADRYYDHHMLFHLLLSPFVAWDVVHGAKWASALFGAIAYASVYVVLIRRGVRHAGWWLAALLALAPDFLFRMQMPRVQALSLVVLLVATELLVSRRYAWLLPLGIAYAWLYDGAPLLLLVAVLFVMAQRASTPKPSWAALAYPLLGILLGLVVNPYFPNDLWFIAHHYAGKLVLGDAILVGSEWHPYPVARWLGWGGAVSLLATSAILAVGRRDRLNTEKLFLLFVGGLFFVLVWRSRRFIEYAAPLLALALATNLHEWMEGNLSRLPHSLRRVLAVALLTGCVLSAVLAASQLRDRPAAHRYAECARWLSENTAPGSVAFTPDWDIFPLLFFHNRQNRYVAGLDPAYLAQRDADLYRVWQGLREGELTPPSSFLERFEAGVVLSSRDHDRFLEQLAADRRMQQVYEDGDCLIFRRRR
jgi:hypothetical protein